MGQPALYTIALRMVGWLLRLLGGAAALSHEPLPDGFFGIAVAQTVQTDKPLGTGWAHSGVLPVGAAFDCIAVSLQQQKEGLVGIGFSDNAVNVLPDDAPHGGPAVLLRFPFAVVLALALGGDDGQIVFAAQLIRGAAHLVVVALWAGVVFLPVHKGNGIDDDVVVQMGFVQMRPDDHLIPLSEHPPCKLHPNLMCLLRCNFAGGKGLDEVVAENAACFSPTLFGRRHFAESMFRTAAIQNSSKETLLCFLWVDNIPHTTVQSRFFSIGHIGHPLIQSVTDGDNLGDCHVKAASSSARFSSAFL